MPLDRPTGGDVLDPDPRAVRNRAELAAALLVLKSRANLTLIQNKSQDPQGFKTCPLFLPSKNKLPIIRGASYCLLTSSAPN